MDSDRLNRWLTLGANVGVLIGIVFLAFELQQNNENLAAQQRAMDRVIKEAEAAELHECP